MSDRIAETHDRLDNWSRWCRNDGKPGRVCISHLYRMAPNNLVPGYGDVLDAEGNVLQSADEAAPEPILAPVDGIDAGIVDKRIMLLPWTHIKVIKTRWFHRHWVPQLEEDAAVRALADKLDPSIMRDYAKSA